MNQEDKFDLMALEIMEANTLTPQLSEMGRKRSVMTAMLSFDITYTVQEHLWKLFAYSKDRHQDVYKWLATVEERRRKFSLANVRKDNPKKHNCGRKILLDKFVIELFEDGDIEVLNKEYSQDGFPFKTLSENDFTRMRELATKFVDCILSSSKFTIEGSNELLEQ